MGCAAKFLVIWFMMASNMMEESSWPPLVRRTGWSEADYTLATVDHYMFVPFFRQSKLRALWILFPDFIPQCFGDYLHTHYPIKIKQGIIANRWWNDGKKKKRQKKNRKTIQKNSHRRIGWGLRMKSLRHPLKKRKKSETVVFVDDSNLLIGERQYRLVRNYREGFDAERLGWTLLVRSWHALWLHCWWLGLWPVVLKGAFSAKTIEKAYRSSGLIH